MLIDLGRNDVGRVARVGTVRVDEQMVVERYSHVMHLVSSVSGAARRRAQRARRPARLLSRRHADRRAQDPRHADHRRARAGAARRLRRRGRLLSASPATSTWRSPSARSSRSGDTVYVQAGAGIVADSDPDAEYEETVNKARAVVRALEMARDGTREVETTDAAADRQLRLVHLQPGAVPRRAGRRGARRAQRRHHRRRGGEAGAASASSSRPGRARRTRPASRSS